VTGDEMSQPVQLTVADMIATITLDRADKLNALSRAMLEAIDAACVNIDRDESIRAVLFCSSSPRAFCAGADIAEWSTLRAADMWARWIRDGHRVFDRIARLRQPTIAVIDGIAYGGGLELALACDLRIASTQARFGFPEVTIAAIPGWSGARRLPQVIGVGRAKQLVLTGESIDAETAATWGLVNEVVPPERLAQRALELARRIAENAPNAVQISKQLADASTGEGIAMTLDALAGGLAASAADAREGIAAFRDKRKPKFTGR
jgi:enoyl-CoA hydratase